MSFLEYPQPDACRAWMPTTPLPPGASPPSPPMVCYMPAGHDGPHSNERRPSTLSRRWEGDARPGPAPEVIDRLVAAAPDLRPEMMLRLDSVARCLRAALADERIDEVGAAWLRTALAKVEGDVTEAPVPGSDTRTRLAEAMSVQHGCDTLLSTSGKPCNRCRQSAAALLPVVESIAAERAAETLEQAALATAGIPHPDDVREVIRARAASLRAASRGETGR